MGICLDNAFSREVETSRERSPLPVNGERGSGSHFALGGKNRMLAKNLTDKP